MSGEPVPRGLTVAEILAFPAAATLKQANAAFGMSDSTGYALRRQGTYPVPVLELGRCLKVRRSDILAALGIQDVSDPGGCLTTTPGPDERATTSHQV